MIPIGDSPRTRRFPAVNWLIIAINALVFFFELQLGQGELEQFIRRWGAVPVEVNAIFSDPLRPGLHALATLFTSQFIHGGWLHILSNMLFLWIFGDNIEDALGSARYLGLYLISGAVGGVVQAIVGGSSGIPLVGASGAVAGVLGAYLLLYPQARVSAVVPIFLFFTVIQVPALVMILLWFLTQLASGVMAISRAAEGGIGYWAHIGGFAAGLVILVLMGGRRNLRARVGQD